MTLLYAERIMGNGLVDDLTDVIYVDIKKFNKLETLQIADEIEQLNRKMMEENRKYILIGPGRWGSRDHFIGIPVLWTQISNAKVIVETSFEGFPLDGSSGSHFFHNVTSMNIGYFSVQHTAVDGGIHWEKLENQTLIEETKYCKHVRFKTPIVVKMDGKNQIGFIEIK